VPYLAQGHLAGHSPNNLYRFIETNLEKFFPFHSAMSEPLVDKLFMRLWIAAFEVGLDRE
jgi:lauroyl/myristoyl acyltransferase